MRYLIFILGLALFVVGSVLGYLGDAPINHPAYTSLTLMVVGGVTLAIGVAILLFGAAMGSSEEEGRPEGFIRP